MIRKIIVIGNKGAGKDEFALGFKKLRYKHGTSFYICKHMYRGLGYPDPETMFKNREPHRQAMVDFMESMFSSIYGECLEENDILTGIRRPHELKYLRTALNPFVIWVRREGTFDETNKLTSQDADFVIENDGDIYKLHTIARRLEGLIT